MKRLPQTSPCLVWIVGMALRYVVRTITFHSGFQFGMFESQLLLSFIGTDRVLCDSADSQ